jgi:hypothetical protein
MSRPKILDFFVENGPRAMIYISTLNSTKEISVKSASIYLKTNQLGPSGGFDKETSREIKKRAKFEICPRKIFES